MKSNGSKKRKKRNEDKNKWSQDFIPETNVGLNMVFETRLSGFKSDTIAERDLIHNRPELGVFKELFVM